MIRQSVTIKDPLTGKMKAQDVEVEGPIAYIETTTASVLNAENTSRCFEVYLDESEQQTGPASTNASARPEASRA